MPNLFLSGCYDNLLLRCFPPPSFVDLSLFDVIKRGLLAKEFDFFMLKAFLRNKKSSKIKPLHSRVSCLI